jgi:hypothetical protein
MLNTHLHNRYFLSNKCSYYIYYTRFHSILHTFLNKTAPVKFLTDAVQVFFMC